MLASSRAGFGQLTARWPISALALVKAAGQPPSLRPLGPSLQIASPHDGDQASRMRTNGREGKSCETHKALRKGKGKYRVIRSDLFVVAGATSGRLCLARLPLCTTGGEELGGGIGAAGNLTVRCNCNCSWRCNCRFCNKPPGAWRQRDELAARRRGCELARPDGTALARALASSASRVGQKVSGRRQPFRRKQPRAPAKFARLPFGQRRPCQLCERPSDRATGRPATHFGPRGPLES